MTFEQFTKQQKINVNKYFAFPYDTPEFHIVSAFETAAKNFELYKGEAEAEFTWNQLNKVLDLYAGMNEEVDRIIFVCSKQFPRFIDITLNKNK